jgi:outer membrane receptor protein involved in Fe transport
MSISGAASFENVYMVNGVVVQDNLRNTPFNLFIEDALQETTTTTAAVSAEYGRFSGGVVNAVTKSGGNELSGSFRVTFDNDDWTALTPYPNDRRTDKIIPTYEATLGGPILRDRLWFFGAMRSRDLSETRTTSFTSLSFPRELLEDRYEGKLTWSPTTKHTVKGAYTHISSKENGNTYGTIMDERSLVNRATPQDLLSMNYTGILSPKLFVEAQYALRKYTFQGAGSRFTDPIEGTLMLDRSRGNARYWSPTFCGVCDDETRDNNNLVAKVSYFLSTGNAGSHSFVLGADVFDSKTFSNNHQSGSDYRIYGTSTIIRGTEIYPVFDSRTYIQWNPIFEGSQGNRFRTISLFANDSWTLGKRWRFNLGLRYDKNDGKDAVGTVVVKDSAFSPRLAATFDPRGDGAWTATASYAKYVSAIASGVGDTSAGGNPATIQFDYLGPAVNVGNPANPVGTADALTTLWNWFNANGGTSRTPRGTPYIPGLTGLIGEDLASPNVRELTLGLTRRLGSRGLVRVDGIYREYRDFYAFELTTSTGTVSDQFGQVYDVGYTVNTNDVERKYKGLNFQISYRPHERLNFGGNYTLSNARGNFNGETGPNGPVTSSILSNPEYFSRAWGGGPVSNYLPASSGGGPVGDLLVDVRHRARGWVIWDVPVPAVTGRVSLGWMQVYNTGTPYGAVGYVDTQPYVTNPGYVNPPSTVDYYFTDRDAYRMASLHQSDLSLNYSRRLGIRKAEVFFRGTVINVFNRDELTNFTGGALPGSGQAGCGTSGCINTTIQTNATTASLAPFNPFTDTPVEGVHWAKGTSFGRPTSRFAYQVPRTFQFSLGLRF